MNVSFCRRAAKNDVWLMPDRVIHMVLAFPAKDGVNGRVYHSGDTQELYEKVRRLLDDTAAQECFGSAAYQTISKHCHAETAAAISGTSGRAGCTQAVCRRSVQPGAPSAGGLASKIKLRSRRKLAALYIIDHARKLPVFRPRR